MADNYYDVAGMQQAIDLAVCCIGGGFESDNPNELAERHPAAAGALRVLLPFASDAARQAIKRQEQP